MNTIICRNKVFKACLTNTYRVHHDGFYDVPVYSYQCAYAMLSDIKKTDVNAYIAREDDRGCLHHIDTLGVNTEIV